MSVIDGISNAIMEKEVEDGTYLASCGHRVPIDMFLTAIKLFMTSCMKIAMGKKLAKIFKGWYTTHRYIFVIAVDLRKGKICGMID